MRYGWAGDPKVRFRAATGGVLTALGMHLIDTGTVDTVLHVGADPKYPMRSHWVLSQTAKEVLANTGSRYGPPAPLAGLGPVLARAEPFAGKASCFRRKRVGLFRASHSSVFVWRSRLFWALPELSPGKSQCAVKFRLLSAISILLWLF